MNEIMFYMILAQFTPFIAGVLLILLIATCVFMLVFLRLFGLWLQAKLSKAEVTFGELIGMHLRKVNVRTIVLSRITAAQAGLDLSIKDLECHYLTGGRVPNVVRALIAAERKNIDLSFETATALDLSEYDVLKEVQNCKRGSQLTYELEDE